MLNEIKIPSMGATMEEGKIVAWRVKEGDRVKPGEILLEIETDKSVFEMESPCGGVVRRILAAAGDTLPVQTVIALVGEPNDPLPAPVPTNQAPPPGATAAPGPASPAGPSPTPTAGPTGEPKISPRARKLAEQLGVDIRTVRGTGPGGRIESADIEKAAATKPQAAAAGPSGTPKPGANVIPFDPVRLQINRKVVKSKHEIPHFYLGTSVDASRLAAYRQRHQTDGKKLSVNALLMKAIAQGVVAEPALNLAITDAGYVRHGSVNVGLAIESPKGVVIAVVDNVEQLEIVALSARIQQLVAIVRGETPGAIKTTGACLTISNVGMYRADWFIPIIHPGEAAILGIGSVAERAVVINGQVTVRSTMPVTICVDHRIADGAAAARFLQAFAEYLEKLE